MRALVLLSALLLLPAVLPASATHCSASTTSSDVVMLTVGAMKVYVTVGVPYVYQESNNIAGLQRADPGRDDTCHGLITSDTRLA